MSVVAISIANRIRPTVTERREGDTEEGQFRSLARGLAVSRSTLETMQGQSLQPAFPLSS